ncbi:MAG TPA: APC family permease [Planctomycetota bacterium]|nr:APC family permease [Planctomycetota bacterium]
MAGLLKKWLIGERRDIHDPDLFHKVSLVAFLAWVGLGADGLSSSAYGPDEAFRSLSGHTELVVFMCLAMVMTVLIISWSYSGIIEHFPSGGGGYVVATKLLGPAFGIISGCALLVDYVLTITVSIASGADQIFSFLPLGWHGFKVWIEALAIIVLIIMNLRGVKESVNVLVPIFLFFVFSHIVLLVAVFVLHAGNIPAIAAGVKSDLNSGMATLGFLGLFKIFGKAYAQGAGTYTGIEAVSNGVQIMREPKVQTAQKTMVYMAFSLAITAGGLLLAYSLLKVVPEEGKTLNAVLADRLGFGTWFVVLILIAEAALLCIAAQTGFLDGPRVMANMATDSWLPHRFAALSERLTMHYGILIIGAASMATLFLTHGDTGRLVTMYSINVFVTFSLSNLGMCRFWIQDRTKHSNWGRRLLIHGVALTLCASILALQVTEKFLIGGWETLLITSALIALCFMIRRYYRGVHARLLQISPEKLAPADMVSSGALAENPASLDPAARTAVLLVGGYNGLGVHSVLTIWRMFPKDYPQIVFLSVGVVDSANFKGSDEVGRLQEQTRAALNSYVSLANRMGMAAGTRVAIGTDAVEEAEKLCAQVAKEFPRATFFSGKVVFQREKWYHWLLHNQTAYAIQRRLEWLGLPMIVLPVRVRDA